MEQETEVKNEEHGDSVSEVSSPQVEDEETLTTGVNSEDVKHDTKDDSKDDLKDDSKDDSKDHLEEESKGDSKEVEEDPDKPYVDEFMIELLSRGFVDRFLPSLQKSKAAVDQIKSSQDVLIETVEQETNKFKDCLAADDVEQTMIKARAYYTKLIRLRRDMNFLHEKSKKLKKRALKLQQNKQKEELTRAHDQEVEFERERMLTARVAPTASPGKGS